VSRRSPEITLSIPGLDDFGQTKSALVAAGLGPRVSTIEILWDNFCALDPVRLAEDLSALADRVMFHIMWSRYLELDADAFSDYLKRLRQHVRALRPVAVSDHLCRFQSHDLWVGAGHEYSYDRFDHVAARVEQYQDVIGQTLLIENHASVDQPAAKQIEFLHALIARTGCGVLFDVSNAVVGELNGRGNVELWMPLLQDRALRCHVGSYIHDSDVDRFIDTHDSDVSAATEAALRRLCGSAQFRIDSITYERDFNRTTEGITRDLVRIAECTCP
jgi:uncharacterized protein (UPF0276 family)